MESRAPRRVGAGGRERWASRLATFHGDAPRAPPVSPFGTPEQIERTIRETLAGLEGEGSRPSMRSMRAWIEQQAPALRMTWMARQHEGRVRECHGDLHLGNAVRLDRELVAFDCIEFDPALRWLDVLCDAAFLTMDLAAHGRRDLAFRFLDAYLQHTGDYGGVAVLRFYEVYRALVRARLRGPRGAGAGGASGTDYLGVAGQVDAAV